MGRADRIKQQMSSGRVAAAEPVFLSTGSALLNLAITGDPRRGFRCGGYYLFCGDSQSGKTFLCLTSFAEAAIDPAFDQHRLIYDAPEGGALMDLERFFGPRAAARIEPPARWEDGSPRHSQTVQEFYWHLDDTVGQGPCVYVLDSQDSLSSDQEQKKFDKDKRASRRKRGDPKDEEQKGSYGDSKAKVHSACLRRAVCQVQRSGSILVIINQSRDSFDMFNKDAYSGGRALLFYATCQLWSKTAGAIKRTVKGKDRQLGTYCKVRVKKNRETGRDRSVVIPIYHSAGIDEVGSLVDYLVSEGVWGERDKTIVATGLGPTIEAKRERLVQRIEEEGLEGDLRELAAQAWREVEEACRVERKSRYGG